MALSTTQIQQLYTAYLDRTVDRAGLDYWQEQNVSEFELRANLANDNQPEYVELFGDRTREELVTAIYNNMFGRAPEAEGLDYWVNGDGASVPASELQQLFISAASEEDTAAFNAKVAEDEAAIEPAPGVPGDNFSLTADVDDLVGTANDDTFSAGLTVAGSQTLNDFDTIDGGEGTDTLNATLNAGTTTPASLESVENLFFRAVTNQQTVDLSNASGVEQIWNDRSQTELVVNDVQNLVTVGVKGTTVGATLTAADNYTVEYDTGALLATDSAQAIVFDNAKLGDLTITGAGSIKTLNVTAAAGTSVVNQITGSALTGVTAVNIAGAGDLEVTNTVFNQKTLDASEATGNLTLAIDDGVAGQTITLGSGDDVVDATAVNFASANVVSIDGGEGRDTIKVGNTVTIEQLVEKTSNTFEVLNIDGLDAARSYVAYTNIDFEALILTDAEDGAIVTGLTADSDLTLVDTDFNGTTGGDEVELRVTGATASTDDTLNFKVEGRDAAANNASYTVAVDNVETVNVETVSNIESGHNLVTLAFEAGVATSFTLENLNITGDQAVVFDASTGYADLETVDVSGLTAASNVLGDKEEYAADITVAGNVKVTGSAGADKITFGLEAEVTGGEGADLFATSIAATGATTANFATVTDFSLEDTIEIGTGSTTASQVETFTIGSAADLGSSAQQISELTVTKEPGVAVTFADYINEASADEVSFFTFEEETYLVAGGNSAPTVDATTNEVSNASVVKLTGITDLSDFGFVTADVAGP